MRPALPLKHQKTIRQVMEWPVSASGVGYARIYSAIDMVPFHASADLKWNSGRGSKEERREDPLEAVIVAQRLCLRGSKVKFMLLFKSPRWPAQEIKKAAH